VRNPPNQQRSRRQLSPLHVLAIVALLGGFLAIACDDGDDGTPTVSSQITQTPQAGGGTDGGDEGEGEGGPTLADPALQIEEISGLTDPTQLTFLGPNELLVTEKTTGRVMHVRDGEVVGPAVQLKTNFADERGVLGITTHPQFAENNYVYVYWTWTGEGEPPEGLFGEPSDDLEAVPELGNRVDRFTWNGSELQFDRNIIELPSEITDLTMDRRRGNHNAGVIKFGPDGKLYVVNGDQNHRSRLQNVADGPAYEANNQLAGVVLRLNDDGTTPQDNPFVGQVDDEAIEKIFVYGVRNSFGFDFEPQTGAFWIEANGQASYDEITKHEPGDNSGWIQIMGPRERFEDYKALEIDTERKLDAPSFPPENLAANAEEALSRMTLLPGAAYRDPSFSWRYAVAPTSLAFITGDALGAEYEGNMLLGDVNTGSIWRLRMTPDGSDILLEGDLADGVNDNTSEDPIGEMQGTLFAEGIVVATDIKVGPDGTLWITSLPEGVVYHITR
jgi:glucose/arabinose dehydrogenase